MTKGIIHAKAGIHVIRGKAGGLQTRPYKRIFKMEHPAIQIPAFAGMTERTTVQGERIALPDVTLNQINGSQRRGECSQFLGVI